MKQNPSKTLPSFSWAILLAFVPLARFYLDWDFGFVLFGVEDFILVLVYF